MPRKQKKASERYEKAASFFPLCKMSLNESRAQYMEDWLPHKIQHLQHKNKILIILKSYAADIMNSKS